MQAKCETWALHPFSMHRNCEMDWRDRAHTSHHHSISSYNCTNVIRFGLIQLKNSNDLRSTLRTLLNAHNWTEFVSEALVFFCCCCYCCVIFFCFHLSFDCSIWSFIDEFFVFISRYLTHRNLLKSVLLCFWSPAMCKENLKNAEKNSLSFFSIGCATLVKAWKIIVAHRIELHATLINCIR